MGLSMYMHVQYMHVHTGEVSLLATGDHFVLTQVSQIDHEGVQATALKVVCDLLLLYGFEAFKSSRDDSDKSHDGSAKVSLVPLHFSSSSSPC